IHVPSVMAFGALADLELRQGHLRGAATYWKQALAIINDRRSWGRLPLSLIGWVYVRMGEILYEWNALDEARSHLSQGLERVELVNDPQGMIAGYLIAARLMLTTGEITAAEARLEHERPLIERGAFPDWTGRFERLQVELWLAEGKVTSAVTWASKVLES